MLKKVQKITNETPENFYSSESVFEFMHSFKLTKISLKKYINMTCDTSFINDLSKLTNLPLTNYFFLK